MAEKEVALVVRLKNEASSAAKLITDSLKDLKGALGDIGANGTKTGGIVGDLAKELGELEAKSKGLQTLSKIAGQMDKAAATVDKLKASVAESVTELTKLVGASQQANSRATEIDAELKRQTELRKQNTDSLKAAQKAQRDDASELAKAEAALKKYNDQLARTRLTTSNGVSYGKDIVQPSKSAKDSAATLLAGDVAAARQQMEASAASVKQWTQTVNESNLAVKAASGAYKVAASEQADLAGKLDRLETSLDAETRSLHQSELALREMATVATQAGAALGVNEINLKKVSEASDAAAANINKVKDALSRQTSSTQNASNFVGPIIDPTQARAQTAAAGGGKAAQDLAAYKAQAAALQVTKNAMEAAARAATALGREMATTSAPTEELARDFLLAKSRSAELTQAYQAQAVQLNAVRGQTQSTFSQFIRAAAQVQPLANASNQTANALRNVPPIASQAAGGLSNLGSAAQRAGSGLQSAGNSSREALDLVQRLRGQVLSLAASYVGLQSAISTLGQVVAAYRTVEAAQNRLGVVFNQDGGAIKNEMAFLNAQAARLGISFDTLSDQYSKFAIAAKTSNFTIADTRKIFTSVAEAARVSKLSVDQTNGVFLALEQMISKGKVSSEELRRQLGDRLPGAFALFADAIGVSTAELDKMMKKGEVLADSDTMLKFADALDKKFGSQLPESLKTTTTAIGQFQNATYNALLQIGQGGFIEAFTNGLRKMTEYFQSREGRDFFLAIGSAAGTAVQALTALIPYFNELKVVIGAIIGYQFAGTVAKIGLAFTGMIARIGGLAAGIGAATTATEALAVAGRTALAAFGGIPAIIATIVGVGVTAWITSVNSAAKALDEHNRILDLTRAGYVGAATEAEKLKAAAEAITLTQAQNNVSGLRQSYSAMLKDISGQINVLADSLQANFRDADDPVKKQIDQLRLLTAALKSGAIDVKTYQQALDGIAQAAAHADIKELVTELLNAASPDIKDGLYQTADALKVAEDILSGKNGDQNAMARAMGETSDAAKDAADNSKKAAEAQEAYTSALDELKSKVPALADQMKALKKEAEIDDIFEKARAALEAYAKQANLDVDQFAALSRELNGLKDAAKAAADIGSLMKDLGQYNTALGKTAALIKSFEGFKTGAYWDVNHFRVGYGSDTTTSADGSVHEVTKDTSVTQADADRDLLRRSNELLATIAERLGAADFSALTDTQKSAVSSFAYNYGAGSDAVKKLLDLIKSGTDQDVAAYIRSRAADNGGVNADRRNKEAAVFESGDDGTGDRTLKAAEKKLKAQEDFDDSVKRGNDLIQAEIDGKEVSTRQSFIEKGIQELKNEAQKKGVNLTEDDIKRRTELLGKQWDSKHAEDEKNKAAKDAIQTLTALDRERAAEYDKFLTAQKEGDQGAMTEAKARIEELTAKINDAIGPAKEFAGTLSGADMAKANAAIEKVTASTARMSLNLRTASSNVNILGLNTRQMESIWRDFASGFSNAFGDFLQGLRDGKKASEALKDAFLNFAAQFLLKIGQMIVEQQILNALQSFGLFGGGGGGMAPASLFHTGGIVGGAAASRKVNPGIFAAAMRFHSGGLPGLKADEVPAILKKGEEVLTQDDPRNVLSGGKGGEGGGQGKVDLKIINTIDPGEMVSQGIASAPGEQVLFNWVRSNKSKIRSILG